MNLYKKFKELNIDTSCLGIIPGSEKSEYFCTPLGAKVIGWEGVDGIHYCMIRGFKDMVFSVNPMACDNQYVRPIASTFQDFLRLLLACGNTTILEQIYRLDTAEFFEQTSCDVQTAQQASILEELNRHFHLVPLEHPYEYVTTLQESFDYSSLRFSKEYYEFITEDNLAIPEWAVYYEGNFWEHGNCKKAGKEIPINQVFSWGDETWHIPSIYSSSDGLVIDFCVQINSDCIRDFLNKWQDVIESGELPNELQEQMESENPLSANYNLSLILNEQNIHHTQYCASYWNPCFEDGTENDSKTELLCEHYGCNKSYGWTFIRASFPWANKGNIQLYSLSLCVEQDSKFFSGPHFTSKDIDIEFVHPLTEKRHSLTVISCTPEQLPTSSFSEDFYEYPCYFQQLIYKIEPALEQNSYMIRDCNRGDSPRPRVTKQNEFLPTSYCGVGIIGSSHEVSVISSTNNSHASKHESTSCSSLYFKAVENVEWRISFLGKTRDDVEIVLI